MLSQNFEDSFMQSAQNIKCKVTISAKYAILQSKKDSVHSWKFPHGGSRKPTLSGENAKGIFPAENPLTFAGKQWIMQEETDGESRNSEATVTRGLLYRNVSGLRSFSCRSTGPVRRDGHGNTGSAAIPARVCEYRGGEACTGSESIWAVPIWLRDW